MEKVHCINCDHFKRGRCNLRREIVKEITVPENWKHGEYTKKEYKVYNPAKKNKHNNCKDFCNDEEY